MTPVKEIIEETIRLQRQTNILQGVCLALIFVANIFIVLSVLNIRKATRNLREWQAALSAWQQLLNDASAIEARQRQDAEERLDPKGESAVAKPGAREKAR